MRLITLSRRHFVASAFSVAGAAITTSAASAESSVGVAPKIASTDLFSVDYTVRDHEILDYEFYGLPAIPHILFRGPRFDPTSSRDFFTCIGAAQTLGVYVKTPFPQLLARHLRLPAWNVGIGGANPVFFMAQEGIIDYANRGRFVILQIMSARAEPNARFAATPYTEMVRDRRHGDVVRTPVAWERIKAEEPDKFLEYINQSRSAWEEESRALLRRITVPVLLFWFSPKPLESPINIEKAGAGLMDRFPQFVDGTNVSTIRPLAKAFAACLSSRNTGHPLVSRFTGRAVEVDYATLGDRASPLKESHNVYYPSPEMHEDAAAVLVKAVTEMGFKPA